MTTTDAQATLRVNEVQIRSDHAQPVTAQAECVEIIERLIEQLAKHEPLRLIGALAKHYGCVRVDDMGFTFEVPSGHIIDTLVCVPKGRSGNLPEPTPWPGDGDEEDDG